MNVACRKSGNDKSVQRRNEFIFEIMKFSRIFYSLCILLAPFFFEGCGGVQVHRGSFEALVPDAYVGPAIALKNDSNMRKVSISARIPNNKRLHLDGIENDSVEGFEYSFEPTEADIYYDFKIFPVTASFDYYTKKRALLGGVGFGFGPYPYFRFTGGFNVLYLEMGAFVSLGFGRVTYSAYAPYIKDQGNMAGAGTSTKGVIECDECYEFKLNGNIGFYINAFLFRDFTISYSISAYNPWLYSDLQGYPLAFDFPSIFSQYFGGSYLFARHFQVSLGANVHWCDSFSEVIWNVESKFSILF